MKTVVVATRRAVEGWVEQVYGNSDEESRYKGRVAARSYETS
ncbi:MAG: hypothetical protein SWE60_05155 [Thermodesulfobacteriota bacterium]|nr:hypothetical protein [Thermodesulfobacteriota bacterium]